MRHNVLRRCFAWFGVSLLLFTAFIVPYITQRDAYAASLNYQVAADEIRAASRIQRIVNVAKKCTTSESTQLSPKASGAVTISDAMTYWNAALNGTAGDTNMPSGPWLEDEVQNKVDDGEIHCDNGPINILQVFANYLGYDLATEVACNGDEPGILTAYVNGEYTHAKCSSLIGQEGYTFQWRTETNINKHMKYLYEKYKTDNPRVGQYLPGWDDVGNFTDKAVSYYVYYDDFWWACASGDYYTGDTSILPKDVYWDTTIPVLNTNTGEYNVWRNYKKECTGGDDNSKCSWDSSVVGDSAGARSCTDVIKKLREYGTDAGAATKAGAESALKEAQDAAKSRCNWIAGQGLHGDPSLSVNAQLDIAKQIIADPEAARTTLKEQNPDATEEQLDEAVAKVVERAEYVKTELEALIATGVYWEEGEEGEIICKTWPSVYNGDITPDSQYTPPPTEFVTTTVETTQPVETPLTCANSGGAASLGWIVCPILEWMGRASEELYSNYLEPALQIEPKLFKKNSAGQGTDSTEDAWGVFQGIANICFIILFLAVIFSQLTGVGIDNYGIKRILPKMIVAAILVNLSYYICLIAVDLSNILGNGLQAMFDNLPTGASTLSIPDSNATLSAVSSTAITGVAVLGTLVLMVGAIWKNPAVLLSLLVGALGVIIAIFFLFVLLTAREAAIVVLVVISPLAMACYMLPNTKKLFDRWIGMMKGLLLVYPIAGLLVGGGNYVSKLLLSTGFASGGFVSALTSMIVGVIPIFFIPTVLKSSFAALGNLGAKISGLGDRMRGGVDRKIRNSEGFKNAQRAGLERRTRIKAGLDKNGNLTAHGERKANRARSRVGQLFGSDKRQAAYIAAAKKNMGEGEAAGASLSNALARTGISSADNAGDLLAGNGMKIFDGGSESAYYGRQFITAARAGNISSMNSAIEAMRGSNMKSKDIAKVVRAAQNGGDIRIGSDESRASWYRELSKKYGGDFLATDYELGAYAMGGGTGNDGNLGDYGTFVAKRDASGNIIKDSNGDIEYNIGMDDIKPEEFGKMSGDSMAGMLASGIVDASMAQRAIEANANISADKKIMLSAMANGATVTDATAFKNAAKDILNATSADFASGPMSIGGIDVTEAMRNAWTSATPDSVNVVQNFHGGGQQFEPVEVKINHEVKVSGTPGSAGGFSADDVKYAEWQAGHWEENKRNLGNTGRDTTPNNPPR